ncbi:hypothetical protein CB1_000490063 [Camelus ferus]|nr:hypothetical protein CB1_000490063 [Camelus ferus]
MDSAAKDKMQPTIPPGPEWPEQERAEQLARGAALKWASGIFYRPEQLARLGQYRSREVQRTCSLEARIKSVVQSYLEGVKTGVRQLAWALEAMQGAREALSQAHGLLRGMAEAAQTLEPVREQVVQHKQLWALSQLLPRLRAAEVDAGRTTSLEQAPRDWRQRCLRALQEGLERIHFGTLPQPGPGALAEWLEALRVALPAELATAEALVAPCCPPHYKVVQLWAHTLHSSLRRCLQQLLERPELGAADTFTLLQWALHVYLGSVSLGQREVGGSEVGGSV